MRSVKKWWIEGVLKDGQAKKTMVALAMLV
jgi:hypothetical protein